jgi:hypothetical protein
LIETLDDISDTPPVFESLFPIEKILKVSRCGKQIMKEKVVPFDLEDRNYGPGLQSAILLPGNDRWSMRKIRDGTRPKRLLRSPMANKEMRTNLFQGSN